MDLHSKDKMKSRTAFLVSLFLTVVFTCLRQSSAQPGWLSIDCGAPTAYVDGYGVSWVPDTAFVTGGTNVNVVVDPSSPYPTSEDIKTARYFTDGSRKRYCYKIPTKKNQLYLLKFNFLYQGFGSSPTAEFEIGFDNYVKTIFKFTATSAVQLGNLMFRPSVDYVYFCLFRISTGDNPFINSLQLRPLEDTMYSFVTIDTVFITEARVNYGNNSDGKLFLRYPEDPFDRDWASIRVTSLYTTVASNRVMDSGLAASKPPVAVMNTLVTSATEERFLLLDLAASIPSTTYFFNLYFAELEPLAAGQVREFSVSINNVTSFPSVNVYSLAKNALYTPVQLSTRITLAGTPDFTVRLKRVSGSSLSPILNSIECFSLHNILTRTLDRDASAVESAKKSFGLADSWTGDPCLLLPYDWLNCTAGSSPRVTAVMLSNYNLTGSIPSGLKDLTELTTLSLDKNKLTGSIPSWLASLPKLKELDLRNNDLSGRVPEALLTNSALVFRFDGNPRLCVKASCPDDKSSVGLIVGAVVGAVAVLVIIVLVVVYFVWSRKKKSDSPSELSLRGEEPTRGCKFTYTEVMAATKNKIKMVGTGAFGDVFYGKLPDGQEVAVKVSRPTSSQGFREFINEVDLLTNMYHKNLVTLVGYCNDANNLILLYEYMPLGSLQDHLYGETKSKRGYFLEWPTRIQIAIQAAQGLNYLHTGCRPAVYHRDVKSSNILLGNGGVAKVADFGLSKETDSNGDVHTTVKGSPGYVDPEYSNTNQYTDKSDVYSFGIVLLELICGRAPFFTESSGENVRLDTWARSHLVSDSIQAIVDPSLVNNYHLDSVWNMASLAMRCVEPQQINRPNMREVLQELLAIHETATS